jgi:hypothetical protein
MKKGTTWGGRATEVTCPPGRHDAGCPCPHEAAAALPGRWPEREGRRPGHSRRCRRRVVPRQSSPAAPGMMPETSELQNSK